MLSPSITWSSGGVPRTVTFSVTRDGAPVSGVEVDSESTSGTTGEVYTDSSGLAVVHPGEDEVVSIYIDGRRIALRPIAPGEWFFLPSCRNGLTIHVAL